jgi:beta-lactamase superfamily II metal-dependent hydrolase
MSKIKSFSVGNGDTFYISHNSSNFTIIDCCLDEYNADRIIAELKAAGKNKEISRFISTHPDDDHLSGIEKLDAAYPIVNFYVVKNEATKVDETTSFAHYRSLRDGDKAFYVYKGCKRKWMNETDETRGSSGLEILWPEPSNSDFALELKNAKSGLSPNNTSLVMKYSMQDGGSVLWLGDLETAFMEKITDSIQLCKVDVVFAAHHGRASGKIPNSWLDILQPEVVILGEAPSRHMHYYTDYNTIRQNSAGDIEMELRQGWIDFFVSEASYGKQAWLVDEGQTGNGYYIGSLAV